MSATPPKPISAVRKYGRSKTPKQRNARVGWKRIKDNIDDLVAKTGANPELGSVISRWVYFGHLTRSEGYTARMYGEIVGQYERFFMEGTRRNSKSPSYQRGTAGAEDILAKKERDGTIADYERAAKKAKKRYFKMVRLLEKYTFATDRLNDLCIHDIELPTEYRPHVKIMLNKIGVAFGVMKAPEPQEKK